MSKIEMIGWDIGGAHIKLVGLTAQGQFVRALQVPCPLWKGLDFLARAISDALETLQILPSSACHVITMTGELVDFFPNRHTGVVQIATTLNRFLRGDHLLGDHLPGDNNDILFYAANSVCGAGDVFVRFDQVASLTKYIASANWHASASVLAQYAKDALLIDIGSTTTDIIPIQSGKLNTINVTDAERMQTDQLIYTGVVRTPVMALANKLFFNGVETNVAAEYFATMADVYRLTGELSQAADLADTADGQGKSLLESARRLARIVGHDVEDKQLSDWKDLAHACRTMQVAQIKAAVLKYLKPNTPMIGAGAGAFLVRSIAEELGHAYMPASQVLAQNVDDMQALEVCFPAYAVAHLYLISTRLQLNQSHSNQLELNQLELNQVQSKQKIHA